MTQGQTPFDPACMHVAIHKGEFLRHTGKHWKGLMQDLGYPPSLQGGGCGGCGALASHTGQLSHLCQAFDHAMLHDTPMIGGSQGPETWHPEVQNTKRVWDGNVAEPPRPSADSSFQAALVGVSASDLAAELQAVNMSPFPPEFGPTKPRITQKIELGHAQPGPSRPHRRQKVRRVAVFKQLGWCKDGAEISHILVSIIPFYKRCFPRVFDFDPLSRCPASL
jgi:hypothetical protein